ncbi:MAG: 4-hydroxy-3-methylbut-2-en-1-yl diphosphate synthase [Planctomycetaceae bacterium]|nr:4-hydroxy-3-methylbut-2-en-1-yl diphosphate synthase [Planctomycetaceae bacterium]
MNSINNIEVIRKHMADGHVAIGTGVTLADPAVSELNAEVGYDFTWIDTEHNPLDLSVVDHHIMAHRGTSTAPFVRVLQNEVNTIKPIVDMHPAGIIVPQVSTRAEAEAAVRACRYPPVGVRGYGPRRGIRYGKIPQLEYLEQVKNDPILVIQIEHIDAVNNIDDLLDVPGIDVYCFGPNDLSGSLNKLGQHDDPEVVAAIETAAQKICAAGRTLGASVGYSDESFERWMKLGVKWINAGADCGNLFNINQRILQAARSRAT